MLHCCVSYLNKLLISPKAWLRAFGVYWRAGFWHKALVVTAALALLALGAMYGIARWYIASERSKPLVIGATFIPAYAESLGLDPQETLHALIQDVGVRHFRLVSYWDQMEAKQGTYDFSLLDWQFRQAEQADAKVSLSIGLRQPRWPECHMPGWAAAEDSAQWQPQLEAYISAVVNRYKDSPALESYQLENEALLKSFGECPDTSRARLVSEYELVKKLDGAHPIIMSRSNNLPSLPLGDPRPDIVGFSIYRRVWDATLTHRYMQYPMPAWYYASLAGLQKLIIGRESVVHELQTEAWPPNGKSIPEISLEEQNKSFDAERFRQTVIFAKATGMRQMDLWGAEYWYYRKVKLHDDSLWRVAQETY